MSGIYALFGVLFPGLNNGGVPKLTNMRYAYIFMAQGSFRVLAPMSLYNIQHTMVKSHF